MHHSMKNRSLPALILVALAGCVTHDPSERFANAMRNQLGKSIDDPSALRNRSADFRGTTRKLSNGNTEEQLVFSSKCAALFEIDQRTRQITGWRKARSAALFVGSTPGAVTNDQSAGSSAIKRRHVAAVLSSGQDKPCVSQ